MHKFQYWVALSLGAFTSPAVARLNQYSCPLLGPAFPQPERLSVQSLRPYTADLTRAIEEALAGGTNPYGEFDNATSSFSVALWSTASNDSLFEYHFEGSELRNASGNALNNDTVFRIGSISKVFTVYAYLATVGEAHLDEPITRFVPELAEIDREREDNSTSNDVDNIRWSDVTPRSLGAMMSGLPRDYGLGDYVGMVADDSILTTFGFPPLQDVPKASCFPFTADQNNKCSRAEFFQGIRSWHPVAHPYSTPTYSNANFGILAWALEAIIDDGRSFSHILQDSVVSALDLKRTFLNVSSDVDLPNAMMPFNATAADWYLTGSFDDPAGNYYSTLNDMNAFGRSILRSSLIPRRLTNRWLKPVSHTSNPAEAAGMPWEIYRHAVPVSKSSAATRMVDMYTKAGDVGLYSTMLVLIPDYNVGFTVLNAGSGATPLMRVYLTEMMRDHFLPALEELAAKEAEHVYAGTYVDEQTNSSVTVTLHADRVGLGFGSWRSRGIDMQEGWKGLYGSSTAGDIELRLQPMGLVDADQRRVSFRIIPKDDLLPETSIWGCFSWASVDGLSYGGIGVDQVVFDLDDGGRAKTIDLRAFRTVLEKVDQRLRAM